MSNFMKIHLAVLELFYAYGQTDLQSYLTGGQEGCERAQKEYEKMLPGLQLRVLRSDANFCGSICESAD
jgi:hypothetical protein